MAKSRRNSVKKNKTRTRPKTRPKTKNRRRRNLRRSYKLRGAGIADLWNSVTGTPSSVTGTNPTSVSGTNPTSVTGNSFTDLWNSGNNWFNNAIGKTPSATGQPPSAINNSYYSNQNPFASSVGTSNNGDQYGPVVSSAPLVSSNNGDQDGPVGVLMNPDVSYDTNGGKKRMTKRRVIRGGQSFGWLKKKYSDIL